MDETYWDERYSGTDLVWTAEANRFVVESKITAQLPHPGVPPSPWKAGASCSHALRSHATCCLRRCVRGALR